jgi:RND family efflux transporter MFP subunit
VASAQTSLDIAERDLQRQQTLLKAGAIAPRDVEAAQRTYTSAKAQLEAARAQLANASKNLANATIVAPFTGVVSQKSISAGDVVQPGTALYTVVDPSTMRLDAAVSSNQLASVKTGTDVVFTVNGYPGREFHGRITRVSPVVDPTTRQVMITATVPNAGNTLVAGLYAEGRLSSTSQRGIVVPMSAVDTRMQRPAVVKVRNGKVERNDVELGVHDANTETVQVVSGVNPGDTLLVAAAQAITPGTPVKVQASPSDANPPIAQNAINSTSGSPAAGGGTNR